MRRKYSLSAVMAGVLACCAMVANAQIVGHAEAAKASELPKSTVDAIGKQTWLFTHASVGGNMIKGMKALNKEDPKKYPLKIESLKYDKASTKVADRPDNVSPGTVYECNRANPGWAAKYDIFRKAIEESGWNGKTVQFAMDKLCYVDPAADPEKYTDMMSKLEKEFPQTNFVYTTLPLKTDEDSSNIQRNEYNEAVRKFAKDNKKLLFDIADIQSHDESGKAVTFTKGGKTYQKLHEAYTGDGGHLNTEGAKRVALGWYAVAASKVQK